MPDIPWPLSSAPGLDTQESAGRLINAYPEKTEVGSPNQVIWRRVPGLSQLVDISGQTHCRGFYFSNSTLITIVDQKAYAITELAGVFSATLLGNFSGNRPVTIAKNGGGIVAVDLDSGAKNLFTSSAPTDFADTDLPASPKSVSVLNNYLLFVFGSGLIYSTGINNLSIATNANVEAPGPLLRGVTFRGEFFAFGADFIKPYRDVGASPFPLEPAIQGVIPRGIVGTFAVAGWEPGWSNELCWVGDDNVVYKLDGYQGTRISQHAVERAIENTSDRSAIECSVAMSGGHAFLHVTSPGNWTWVRDFTTGEWHERQSYNRSDFRGSCSIKAFDRWIMGDRETGKIAEYTSDVRAEFGDPLIFEMQSGVPKTFPAKGVVARSDFDFTVSVGNTDVPDPTFQISWSRDGGQTWSTPVNRHLGALGASRQRVSVQRVGMFREQGIRFRVRVSDAVHVGFKGGQMALLPLAA